MPTVREVYDFLKNIAPLNLQMDYDNSGMLIGDQINSVKRALLALDVTEAVIEEALDCRANLIISHHPLIFHPIRNLTRNSETEKYYTLIKQDLAVICFHTNLDIVEGGVNDVLLELLGAEYRETLDQNACGRIGEYEKPFLFLEYLSLCRKKLKTNGLRYYDAGKNVKRIVVMGGSGASAIRDAAEKGCDTYITADLRYHDFLLASELGLNLIDGDHFCTENPVLSMLQKKMQEAFPDVETIISRRHGQIVQFA